MNPSELLQYLFGGGGGSSGDSSTYSPTPILDNPGLPPWQRQINQGARVRYMPGGQMGGGQGGKSPFDFWGVSPGGTNTQAWDFLKQLLGFMQQPTQDLGLPKSISDPTSIQDMAGTHSAFPQMKWGFGSTPFEPTPAPAPAPTPAPYAGTPGTPQFGAATPSMKTGSPTFSNYGAPAGSSLSTPFLFSPSGGAGTSQPPSPSPSSPGLSSVSGGIPAPITPPLPTIPTMTPTADMSPWMTSAADPYATQMAGAQNIADQGKWYESNAALQNQYQGARGQSGQQWSSLMNYLQNLFSSYDQKNQSLWTGMLGGLGW